MKEEYLKILYTYKSSMFKGRTSRKEFVMSYLYWIILGIPVLLFSFIIPIISLCLLITIIPIIALIVRRLHDLNLSGWFFILIYIPYVNIIFLILILFKKGDPDENQYGSPLK